MAASIDSALARYPSLAGKTVLITGGATGIGAAFVEHFFDQGAKVAFFDIDTTPAKRSPTSSARISRKAAIGRCSCACDLTDIDALRKGIADVRSAFGPIAVLVNNAANDKRHSDRRRDAGVVRRRYRGQHPPSVLRGAGGDRRHEAAWRRLDHQSRFDQLDAEERRLSGVRDGEVGGAGHDARSRARPRAVQYPREYARAGLGHDGEAKAAVARRRRPSRDQGRPVHRRRTAAGASRAHGALPRRRRQPHDHRAGRRSSTEAGREWSARRARSC